MADLARSLGRATGLTGRRLALQSLATGSGLLPVAALVILLRGMWGAGCCWGSGTEEELQSLLAALMTTKQTHCQDLTLFRLLRMDGPERGSQLGGCVAPESSTQLKLVIGTHKLVKKGGEGREGGGGSPGAAAQIKRQMAPAPTGSSALRVRPVGMTSDNWCICRKRRKIMLSRSCALYDQHPFADIPDELQVPLGHLQTQVPAGVCKSV